MVMTSAASPWHGMLGFSNATVRIIHLVGQTSYQVTAPFSGRDYCGKASGLTYWGVQISTNPQAPTHATYVDLPAVC